MARTGPAGVSFFSGGQEEASAVAAQAGAGASAVTAQAGAGVSAVAAQAGAGVSAVTAQASAGVSAATAHCAQAGTGESGAHRHAQNYKEG